MRKNKSSGKKKWIDADDAPELTREFFRRADVYEGEKLLRRGRPPVGERPKEAVKLRLSPDVLDYFRAGGPGWPRHAAAWRCWASQIIRHHRSPHRLTSS